MKFIDRICAAMRKHNSLVCVGLDPLPERLPESVRDHSNPLFAFNKAIIDATADIVCAFKPQAAHYHALGAEQALKETIDYIRSNYPDVPVILDSKRGDIGSTAARYAVESFERYNADAVTINPYMGIDTIAPFTCYKDRGVVVLCRTSNDGAAAIQNLKVGEQYLYEKIAEMAVNEWNENNNILLVVGATRPQELKRIREITGDMTFLVPGLGAQGGDMKEAISSGLNSQGEGMIVNSSRGIIYAGSGADFADCARQATLTMRDQINALR